MHNGDEDTRNRAASHPGAREEASPSAVARPDEGADARATGQSGAEADEITTDDPRLVAYLAESYDTVAAYRELLADQGVLRGLIGPREVPRLWDRHILNSAAVAQFLPGTGTVADVGSGAGLPGVVLAAMRPGLHVVLVEPMDRRTTWLNEVVAELGLSNVEVVRGRAEDLAGTLIADVVTARAVAPLAKLARWTLPLLRDGGALLALKGRTAGEELAAAEDELRALGGERGEVLEARTIEGVAGTYVVRVVRTGPARPAGPSKPTRPSATTPSRSGSRGRRRSP